MFYTTSCRGHKITVICGFTVVSHVQEFSPVEIYHAPGTEHTTELQGFLLIQREMACEAYEAKYSFTFLLSCF